MSDPAQETKAGLRERVRRALKELAPSAMAAASRQLCARLEEQELWKRAQAILFFAPLAAEPDIWPLVAKALVAGKIAALPRFVPEGSVYEACRITDCGRDVQAGEFGIREPAAACARIELNRLDLVLVPGVAFDLDGRRLGRGKGFYDRLLAPFRGPACGVAFDQQLAPQVPVGSHDVRLSYILTPPRGHVVTGPRAVLK
jgi:5-formyltetrahydrofolate cyclo-ligase